MYLLENQCLDFGNCLGHIASLHTHDSIQYLCQTIYTRLWCEMEALLHHIISNISFFLIYKSYVTVIHIHGLSLWYLLSHLGITGTKAFLISSSEIRISDLFFSGRQFSCWGYLISLGWGCLNPLSIQSLPTMLYMQKLSFLLI